MPAPGYSGGLYYNTAPVADAWANPVWVLVCEVRDLTVNLELATADITTRCAEGFRQRMGTLADGTIEFQLTYEGTRPHNQDTLWSMYWNRMANTWAVTDRLLVFPNPAAIGLQAWMQLTNMSWPQNLEDAMMIDVTLSVTANPSRQSPTWRTESDPFPGSLGVVP
jgi:hypothetical protein